MTMSEQSEYSRINKTSECPLCARTTKLTFHHLIPKKMHRRTFFRKNYSKEALNAGINICRQCHNGIHKAYDEMTLAKQFTSLSIIKTDAKLHRHFAWVAKQKINCN